jgi:hypothetical protein
VRSAVITALVLLFLGVLASRWPASQLVGRLPAGIECQASGTLWSGRCTPLTVNRQRVGSAQWSLRFLPLLRGELAGTLAVQSPQLRADLQLQRRRSGALVLTDVQADGDIAAVMQLAEAVGVRGGTGMSGRFRARLPALQIDDRHALTGITGELELDELSQPGPWRALGNWTVTFDGAASPAGEPLGQVRDRGGPLGFRGTIRLTPPASYFLEGELLPRAGTPPEMLDALRMFGPADAAGRRKITVEGRF